MSDETQKFLAEVEKKLDEAVARYESQVKESGEASRSVKEELKALSDEHKSVSAETSDRLKEIEQIVAGGYKGGSAEPRKTWGKSVVESDSFKAFAENSASRKMSVEVKNTIIGESGSPQEPSDTLVPQDRLPGIVPGAFRALTVLDFVPTGTTGSNQIEYTAENTWTNAAAETEEGGSKPEATLTFTLVSEPVRTIAHWIKASKQILEDAPMLESYIDRRLRHGLQNRLQTQILKGDGSAPNLKGLDQTGRHTDFTPTTGEIALDSLNRAKYAVIGADYMPNFIFMNPADFGSIERTKASSSSNEYAAGDGAALSYINGGMTPMIWGLPVVTSNDVASGKFYLGDSNAMQLFMRQGITVEMFEQDDTNVQSNLVTIRAEMRAAFAVYLNAAIRYGDLTV